MENRESKMSCNVCQGFGEVDRHSFEGSSPCPVCFPSIEDEQQTGERKPTAVLLNELFTKMFRLQIMTTYSVVVQFSMQGEQPFYTIIMQHFDNGETRVFPLKITAEDLATKTDEEIISSTFNDIEEMLEQPQELRTSKIQIVKG